MSDPNYDAQPKTEYAWDDEDVARHNREVTDPRDEMIRCDACYRVVPKDEAWHPDLGVWLCHDCGLAVEGMMR